MNELWKMKKEVNNQQKDSVLFFPFSWKMYISYAFCSNKANESI